MKHEIIDNRNRQAFDSNNWWGIVWFDNDQEMALGFDTKAQALWFVRGGYKSFTSDYND